MARVVLTMPDDVARELGDLLSHLLNDETLEDLVEAKLTGAYSTVNVDYGGGKIEIKFFSEEVKSDFWRDENVEG